MTLCVKYFYQSIGFIIFVVGCGNPKANNADSKRNKDPSSDLGSIQADATPTPAILQDPPSNADNNTVDEKDEGSQEDSSPLTKATLPPVGDFGIEINQRATATSSLTVSLTLRAPQGIEKMYLSNSSTCLDGGTWEDFAASKEWSLDASQSNAQASVSVKFLDVESETESECQSASILHDNIVPEDPPAFTALYNPATAMVVLSWTPLVSAGGSPLSYEASLGTTADKTDLYSWTSSSQVGSASISLKGIAAEGSHYVAGLRIRDAAGNVSKNITTSSFFAFSAIKTLSSSTRHSCAILENGSVKCWGDDNAYGQLGQNDTSPRGLGPNQMGESLPPIFLGDGRSATQLALGGGVQNI